MIRVAIIVFIGLILGAGDARSQQQSDSFLDLQTAYELASENAPRNADANLQKAIAELRQRILWTDYLPSVSLGGQAVYYSEVARLPFDLPGQTAPAVANDQYRVGLNIEQILYDGGATGRKISLEKANEGYAVQEAAVSLYSIRNLVEDAYFGVLLAEAAAASIKVRLSDMQSRLDELNALVEEGVLVASEADQLQAEILRLEQEREMSESQVLAARDMLTIVTGWEAAQTVQLLVPGDDRTSRLNGERPEIRQFQLAQHVLDQQIKLAGSTRRPHVFSFAEFAYGRSPGLNLFENNFEPFFSVGVRMKWSAWDWKRTSRQQQIFQFNKQLVASRQAEFLQSIDIAVAKKQRDIERLTKAIDSDTQVIELRERILADTASRLQTGLVSAADLIRETNSLESARLAQDIHRLELAYARAQLTTIRGAE